MLIPKQFSSFFQYHDLQEGDFELIYLENS